MLFQATFLPIFLTFSSRPHPLVALAEPDRSQLDTLQYEQQLPRGYQQLVPGRTFEGARLQTLDVQGVPITIPLQQAQLVAALADEDKHVAR